jgi:hypothetical protein
MQREGEYKGKQAMRREEKALPFSLEAEWCLRGYTTCKIDKLLSGT